MWQNLFGRRRHKKGLRTAERTSTRLFSCEFCCLCHSLPHLHTPTHSNDKFSCNVRDQHQNLHIKKLIKPTAVAAAVVCCWGFLHSCFLFGADRQSIKQVKPPNTYQKIKVDYTKSLLFFIVFFVFIADTRKLFWRRWLYADDYFMGRCSWNSIGRCTYRWNWWHTTIASRYESQYHQKYRYHQWVSNSFLVVYFMF